MNITGKPISFVYKNWIGDDDDDFQSINDDSMVVMHRWMDSLSHAWIGSSKYIHNIKTCVVWPKWTFCSTQTIGIDQGLLPPVVPCIDGH